MDVARGIAILMVVITHIGVGETLNRLLYSVHLPVFFIASGYFFRFEKSFLKFLWRKAKGYLLPYLFCSLCISLFLLIRSGGSLEELSYSLKDFALQKRYTALWFLAALFLCNLLFWLLQFLSKQTLWAYLPCVVLACVFAYYNNRGGKPLWWNLDAAFVALSFMAVGHALRKFALLDKLLALQKWQVLLLFAGLAGVSVAITEGNYAWCGRSLEMYHSSYGIFPLTFLAGCFGSIALFLLGGALPIKPLAYLGENAMAYFAFHQAVGIPLARQAVRFLSLPNWAEWVGVFLLTVAICAVIDLAIGQTPLRFLLGKPIRKRGKKGAGTD